MKKKWRIPLIVFLIAATLFTCIDPYNPKLDKFQSIMVVDALLTNENISNYVHLSRTIKNEDEEPEMITGAVVKIKDDLGNSTTLTEKTNGVYKTDSLLFRGVIGRSYTLSIKTADGKEYQSEPCLMYPLQEIDSIYYSKDQEIRDDETLQGLRIFIDSKGESDCQYYRWTYEEWWKFNVPSPKLYEYVDATTFDEYTPTRQTCWGHNKSEEILITSTEGGESNKFIKRPVLFVASEKSNRLLIQYSIQVKQLSISKKEYEFWSCMSQINESGGDIFDKQPFQITGNIININNPGEQVLGYFQVSAAQVKQRYITLAEVNKLDIPLYEYPCKEIALGPDNFPPDPIAHTPPPTFDEIYVWYNNANTIFVRPLLDKSGKLVKLIFATPACADCTLTGTIKKPDFWVDLD